MGVGGGETNEEPDSELEGDGGALYAEGAVDHADGNEHADVPDDWDESGNDEGGNGKGSGR